MTSLFDLNEIWEDTEVREANSAEKIMYITFGIAIIVISLFIII